MEDKVLALLIEARNEMFKEHHEGKHSRESPIVLENIETAILWRKSQFDTPPQSSGKVFFEGEGVASN